MYESVSGAGQGKGHAGPEKTAETAAGGARLAGHAPPCVLPHCLYVRNHNIDMLQGLSCSLMTSKTSS